jgi:urease accessory protein UreF
MSEPTLGDILAEALRASTPPIIAAGRGDGEALRQLANSYFEGAYRCAGLQRVAELAQALTFARLACADGTPADGRIVVFLYGQLAAECRAAGVGAAGDNYEAQGYLLAEMMAESGDEEMADLVVASAAAVSPGAHIEAKRLKALAE